MSDEKADKPSRDPGPSSQGQPASGDARAPRGDSSGSRGAVPPPLTQPGDGRARPLERRLQEFFGTIALGLQLSGDEFGATVVNRRAAELAKAWDRLARENPAVKRLLEGLLTGGAFGEAAMVTLGTLIPILWSRGLVPDSFGLPFAQAVVPEYIADEVTAAAERMAQEGAQAEAARPEEAGEGPAPGPAAQGTPGATSKRPADAQPSVQPQDGGAPGPTPSGGRDWSPSHDDRPE